MTNERQRNISKNKPKVSAKNDKVDTPSDSSSVNGRPPRKSTGFESAYNIQVMLRCRGNTSIESDGQPTIILENQGNPTKIQLLDTGKNREYTFDHIFDKHASQDSVYNKVAAPVIEDVLKGFNCTIFAYGQTGTGKTYTMEGDLNDKSERNAGIIPRTIHKLFQRLQLLSGEKQVSVSMLELYNEDLHDLLCAADKKDLKIYEEGTGVKVQGLTEHPISSANHGLSIMKEGVRRRMTASTNSNDKSSRSHCIFTITVFVAAANGSLKPGKLHLVDLAGSENNKNSGSESMRAREAANINRSLLALGRVIHALVDRQVHVPYRESKLTRLLKESLGGRTKTCIIATIAHEQQTPEEIKSTLDYASLAKGIINQAQPNPAINRERHLDSLCKTIEQLYEELRLHHERVGHYMTNKQYEAMKTDLQIAKDEAKAKEAEKLELLEKEKQNLEEKMRINEKWRGKVTEVEQSNSNLQKEKNDLIKKHAEYIKNKEEEFKQKQKQLENESKAREASLVAEMHKKEALMQHEVDQANNRYKTFVDSVNHFRHVSQKRMDLEWDSVLNSTTSFTSNNPIVPPDATPANLKLVRKALVGKREREEPISESPRKNIRN